VAAQLQLSIEEVAAAETALAPLADICEADAPQHMDEMRIALKEVIGRLELRERQVITMRFFQDMSQQEVAAKLGISQGHVSKIEREVLNKLRTAMG
jgi:RNA polymerase sigma factor (sigma-70 family)